MAVSEPIQNNLAEITAIVGLIFLMVDVWILGLSTVVLLALGTSTIITAFFIWLGLLPASLTTVIGFSGVGAGVLTYLLWAPLKRMDHNKRKEYNIHSDFIGLTFVLSSKFDAKHPASVKYSGVNWRLVLAQSHAKNYLNIGDVVKVVGVDVGQFIVVPEKKKR